MRLAGVTPLVVGIFALAFVPAAAAIPPSIYSAGQSGGHIFVAWSLPSDGSVSSEVEVATKPATGGGGEFFHENVVTFDFLDDGARTWTNPELVKPGTYYVHVSDSNFTCSFSGRDDCFAAQWSPVATVVVPGIVWVGFTVGTAGSPPRPNRAKAGGVLYATLTPDTVGTVTLAGRCSARASGGRLVAFKHLAGKGTWLCAWRVPKTAAGVVSGSITVTAGISSVTRTFSVPVVK